MSAEQCGEMTEYDALFAQLTFLERSTKLFARFAEESALTAGEKEWLRQRLVDLLQKMFPV